MRMNQFVASIVTFALSASIAFAGGDTVLTYQGRLLDAGEPANGTFNLDFTLFDALRGGNQIGLEVTFNDYPVVDGLLTAELDFGASAFDNTGRWLEIAVNGSTLSPRQPISRSPYSIQTRGIFVDRDGNVGIGTTTPDDALHIKSPGAGIHVEDDSGTAEAEIYLSEAGDSGFKVSYSSTANQLQFIPRGVGADLPVALMIERGSGNVGIGTAMPIADLHVVGDGIGTVMNLSNGGSGGGTALVAGDVSGSGSAASFYGITTNDLISVWNDGSGRAAVFRGDVTFNQGRVGIGTTAPEYTLHVVSAGPRAIFGQNTATSGSAYGVFGMTSNDNGFGVYGWNNSAFGYGVYSNGRCHVNGTLSKSGGSFKIDHPLDPENKYLQHSFVESPDMMNVYNGNVILDENGKAYIELPDYFNELNRDFRYQLTPMGAAMPNLHISQEIANNSFRIAGGQAGMKVSWQVTGIRQDPWAQAHRIEVEPYKRPEHQGKYLHPELYGQPKEMAVHYFPDAQRPVTETALAKAQAGPTPNPSTGGTK